MDKIESLKEQQSKLSTEWNEMKKWVGQEPRLNQEVTAQETAVNQIKQQIPPANQSALYWDAFNRMAGETGVTITRIEEGKDSAKGSKPRNVTIAISGSEASVMQFITRMKSMTYVTAVKSGTFAYRESNVLATLQLLIGSREST